MTLTLGVDVGVVDLVMGRVWKKSGLGGFGYTRIFKCRVSRVWVLKKVGFERVISGSGIPGPITTFNNSLPSRAGPAA